MGLDTCTRDASGGPALDAQDGEEMVSRDLGVSLYCDNQPAERGRLFVTTRRVVWFSETDTAKGYSIPFRSISIHALSRNTEAFPHPCVYAQVEVPRDPGAEENGDGDDAEQDETFEGDEQTIEVRFVPEDASTAGRLNTLLPVLWQKAPLPTADDVCPNPPTVDALYQTFCQCALLNPDPVSEDEDDELFYDEDEVGRGAGDAAALEQRFEQMLQMDAGRFADEGDGEEEEEYDEEEEEGENGGDVTMK